MRRLVLFGLICVFALQAQAQLVSGLENISPFKDGLAAVEKGGTWGFIDEEGKLIIDFRADLVLKDEFPEFSSGRCMIVQQKDGVQYFGFIDKTGKEVIPAKYVKASPFENGYAIVTLYSKETIGQNQVLNKEVVQYQIEDYVIDTQGEVHSSLYNAENFVPDKLKKGPPEARSFFMGKGLVAVQDEQNKWSIYKF